MQNKAIDKFNESLNIGNYKFWDPGHPLKFFVGLDDKGRKTLVLVNQAKPETLKKTSAIDVDIAKISDTEYRLSFHLNDASMEGIFYKFCDDLVESTRAIFDESIGMTLVCKRFNLWKKLFYKLNKNTLSEQQQMGLIAELLFLKEDMFKKYEIVKAIDSWSGTDNTHKDFSIDDDWYEIKSTVSSSLTIKISSLEQLDAENEGLLVVYEFEKMSGQFNGLTLNSVVNDVLSMVDSDEEDILIKKLQNVGWEVNDEYDKICFRNVSKNYYLVNDSFPRLSKNNLNPSVVKIKYEILKRDLETYLVK